MPNRRTSSHIVCQAQDIARRLPSSVSGGWAVGERSVGGGGRVVSSFPIHSGYGILLSLPIILDMARVMPGVVLGGLHGSAGNATFVRTPYGVSLRDRTAPRNPRTPAQQSARQRMARASRTWQSLTLEQAQAWREYAASLPVAVGAAAQHPQNVFCKLATKFLQVSPNGEIPLVPPAAPFGGDAVAIAITSIAGALRFSSSSANGAGVTTELLLQPLASLHRRAYAKEYRTRGFHQFTSASSFDVLVPHGVYACAVRFVQVATGLDGGILELGVVGG